MSLFFIDTDNGTQRTHDDVGYEMKCAEAARRHAISTVMDMSSEPQPAGRDRIMSVTVRNERGATLLTATLRLSAE